MTLKKTKQKKKNFIGAFCGLPFLTMVASLIGSRFEQLKMEVRKGSMVNVNPTNTRPPNDTPEIRKYKKRFNSEILCAALWGEDIKNSCAGAKMQKNIKNQTVLKSDNVKNSTFSCGSNDTIYINKLYICVPLCFQA